MPSPDEMREALARQHAEKQGTPSDDPYIREQMEKIKRLETGVRASQRVPNNHSVSKANQILASLYPDEPFFVFRAKDILSTMALDEYARWVEKFHPHAPQLGSIVDATNLFREWQIANPDKIKLPD